MLKLLHHIFLGFAQAGTACLAAFHVIGSQDLHVIPPAFAIEMCFSSCRAISDGVARAISQKRRWGCRLRLRKSGDHFQRDAQNEGWEKLSHGGWSSFKKRRN